MTKTRRLVLDVLKPQQPNALDFSSAIAALGSDYLVKLTVTEVDKSTAYHHHKRTVLKLKTSPSIVLDDLDLAHTVPHGSL